MSQPSSRQAVYAVGAQFETDKDGIEMFTFTADGSTVIGPRPATEQDRERHAAAYKLFRETPSQPDTSAEMAQAELATAKDELATRSNDLEMTKRERDSARAEVESLTKERDGLVEHASMASASQSDQLEAAKKEAAQLRQDLADRDERAKQLDAELVELRKRAVAKR